MVVLFLTSLLYAGVREARNAKVSCIAIRHHVESRTLGRRFKSLDAGHASRDGMSGSRRGMAGMRVDVVRGVEVASMPCRFSAERESETARQSRARVN